MEIHNSIFKTQKEGHKKVIIIIIIISEYPYPT